MFSWEFCEILKNTFFTEHFWATGSDVSYKILVSQWLLRSQVFFRLPKWFTIKIFFRLFECFLLESNFRKLYICNIWIKKGCYLHFLQHCADERVSQFFNPFNATDLFWYPPENIRKPLVFCFQGVSKEISGMKWVKRKEMAQLKRKQTSIDVLCEKYSSIFWCNWRWSNLFGTLESTRKTTSWYIEKVS